MATENKVLITTLTAGEDLYADGYRYHAIALDDGKLAVNGREAAGILVNKPKTGEALTLAYEGELKYAAGAGISKAAKLTVTTSGWFITAGSGDWIVGKSKVAATSGSIGTGIFNFVNPPYAETSASAT